MISLVTKAANEAKAKSSKRVTAAHLKQAVVKDEQLDFLADIISKVPDAPALIFRILLLVLGARSSLCGFPSPQWASIRHQRETAEICRCEALRDIAELDMTVVLLN